jgi:hypothetical protein
MTRQITSTMLDNFGLSPMVVFGCRPCNTAPQTASELIRCATGTSSRSTPPPFVQPPLDATQALKFNSSMRTYRHFRGVPHLTMTASKWDTSGTSWEVERCRHLPILPQNFREALRAPSARECCLPWIGSIWAWCQRNHSATYAPWDTPRPSASRISDVNS